MCVRFVRPCDNGAVQPPEPPGNDRERPDDRRFSAAEAKLVGFGILALLAGIFVGQNVSQVSVHFLFFTAKIRLIWVFLLCIVMGAGLDRLLVRRGLLPGARRRERRRKADQ